MTKKEPFMEVECGQNNGTLTFLDAQQLLGFAQAEASFWSWVSHTKMTGSLASQAQSAVVNVVNKLRNAASELVASPNNSNSAAANILKQGFSKARIPISTSPVGMYIEQLKDEDPEVALAALTTWMGMPGLQLTEFQHIKGAVLMVAFDENITSKVPPTVRKSLNAARQSFKNAEVSSMQAVRAQEKLSDQNRSSDRRLLASVIRSVRKRTQAERSKTQESTAAAIKSLNDTERLYKEHMGLKAPADYWNQKADSHTQKARTYRNTLLWYAAVVGLALVVALGFLANYAIDVASAEKPPAIYLILTTLGVVLTTVAFWGARVLTRLFLSEHHLAIDAEERSVMAQTFLALTAEGEASAQERALVLASLFRPTADGIVKDDAAPDIGASAILSRLDPR